MSHPWEAFRAELAAAPRRWVVTGAAGFIGSNLVEALLRLDQTVVGLDNFATGSRDNLDEVRSLVMPEQWTRFELIEGDIGDESVCLRACAGAGVVLHQAALGSIPRSMEDPLRSHHSNVTGFINILQAARNCGVKRFVYASSSSVYGDSPALPKREECLGLPLSPYAATKQIDEIYAGTFARAYGFPTIGLRYFNVFGPRQNPSGAYAAAISKWIVALLRHEPVFINGDGESTRDFCYVDNVVQANLRAALVVDDAALNQVYNIAVGECTTLNLLFDELKRRVQAFDPAVSSASPVHRELRPGEVRHSLADIGKARRLLGYEPRFKLQAGLDRAISWYVADVRKAPKV